MPVGLMRDVNLPRPRGMAAALMSLTLLVGSAHAAKKLSNKRGGHASSVKSEHRKRPEFKRTKAVETRHPSAPPPAPIPTSTVSNSPPSGVPSRGPTRIDFDDRLIQGQTNKSGAVYLYDRKELKIRSMIKQRESFRDDIIATVYDN
jgi:hypothetical protein